MTLTRRFKWWFWLHADTLLHKLYPNHGPRWPRLATWICDHFDQLALADTLLDDDREPE